jgi:hypothetical protein
MHGNGGIFGWNEVGLLLVNWDILEGKSIDPGVNVLQVVAHENDDS